MELTRLKIDTQGGPKGFITYQSPEVVLVVKVDTATIWESAETIDLDLSQFNFTPLDQDQPVATDPNAAPVGVLPSTETSSSLTTAATENVPANSEPVVEENPTQSTTSEVGSNENESTSPNSEVSNAGDST